MTGPIPIIEAKKRLRAAAKATRSAAFVRHGAAAGAALARHGIGFAGVAPAATVSGFLAIGEEIDPAPLLARLADAGHTLGLPVMVGKGRPLVFRSWRPGEALGEVMWGIREPLPSVPIVEPDLLLVPLLAFDRQGFRVGYGGGFYDRSLARLRAAKPIVAVGLAYDELEVDAVPHTDYDQRLDWVLTPSGPLKCEVPSPRMWGEG